MWLVEPNWIKLVTLLTFKNFPWIEIINEKDAKADFHSQPNKNINQKSIS